MSDNNGLLFWGVLALAILLVFPFIFYLVYRLFMHDKYYNVKYVYNGELYRKELIDKQEKNLLQSHPDITSFLILAKGSKKNIISLIEATK